MFRHRLKNSHRLYFLSSCGNIVIPGKAKCWNVTKTTDSDWLDITPCLYLYDEIILQFCDCTMLNVERYVQTVTKNLIKLGGYTFSKHFSKNSEREGHPQSPKRWRRHLNIIMCRANCKWWVIIVVIEFVANLFWGAIFDFLDLTFVTYTTHDTQSVKPKFRVHIRSLRK